MNKEDYKITEEEIKQILNARIGSLEASVNYLKSFINEPRTNPLSYDDFIHIEDLLPSICTHSLYIQKAVTRFKFLKAMEENEDNVK